MYPRAHSVPKILSYSRVSNGIHFRTIPQIKYIQAKALSADFDNKKLVCQDVYAKEREKEGSESVTMEVNYDRLLISVGSKTNTFNTPGLFEREFKEVFFLKHLSV